MMLRHGLLMTVVLFGSVAESVVREAPVPVLLMRASRSSGAASRAA